MGNFIFVGFGAARGRAETLYNYDQSILLLARASRSCPHNN